MIIKSPAGCTRTREWFFSTVTEYKTLLLILLMCLIPACGGSSSSSSQPASNNSYDAFSNPEKVAITNYTGHAMEPFISRDGLYLFFNDRGPARDIFHADFISETNFLYVGPITSINTPEVDGVPTMDSSNTFFYVSTNNYDPSTAAYDTIYTGTWDGSTVTGSVAVAGLAITTPGFINFDVDVSPDGSTLYFNDGDFTGGSPPDTADIVIAVDSGGGFVRDPNSAVIMANVNTTADLEYAPCISSNGLELFFTRLDLGTSESSIYRAARSSTTLPFGVPQKVSAIEGFVEGPALSPDERSLYYHRMNTGTGLFEIYRVTRP